MVLVGVLFLVLMYLNLRDSSLSILKVTFYDTSKDRETLPNYLWTGAHSVEGALEKLWEQRIPIFPFPLSRSLQLFKPVIFQCKTTFYLAIKLKFSFLALQHVIGFWLGLSGPGYRRRMHCKKSEPRYAYLTLYICSLFFILF